MFWKKIHKHIKRWERIYGIYFIGLIIISFFSFLYIHSNPFLITFLIFFVCFGISYTMHFWFKLFLHAKRYRGKYLSKITLFTKQCNFKIDEIYTVNFKRYNACAGGFLNSSFICYSTSMLKDCSWDEIKAVTTHELGHHINKDTIFYTAIISLSISFLGYIHSVVIIYLGNTVSTFMLANIFGCLAFFPTILAISRWREGMADEFAKKSKINNKAFSKFFKRTLDQNEEMGIVVKDDIFLFGRLFLTHPWIYDRIRFFDS